MHSIALPRVLFTSSPYKKVIATGVATIAVGGLGYGISTGGFTPGGGGGGGDTANIWVDQNGGTCVDNASLVAYNDAQACTPDAANDTCENGDNVVVKGGTSYGSLVEIYGWNSRTNYCNFVPATGENVVFGQLVMGSWRSAFTPSPCTGTPSNSNSIKWFKWTGPLKMATFQADCAQNVVMDGGSGEQLDMDASLLGDIDTCTGDSGTAPCVLQPWHVADGNPSDVTFRHFKIHDAHNPNGMVHPGGDNITFEYGTIRNNNNDSGGGADIHDECMYTHTATNLVIRGVRFHHCYLYDIFFTGSDTFPGLVIENSYFARTCSDTPIDGCSGFRTTSVDSHDGGTPNGVPGPNAVIRYNTFIGGFETNLGTSGNTITGNYYKLSPACLTGTYSYNAYEGGVGCSGTNQISGSYNSTCFVDNNDWASSGGDWHLNSGCALRSAGNPANFPTLDQAETTRTNPPDIGAYNH